LLLLFLAAPAAGDESVPLPAALPLHPMLGPFARVEGVDLPLARAGSIAPFLDAKLVDPAPSRGYRYYRLALRTARGWYVDPLANLLVDDGTRSHLHAGPARVTVENGVVLLRFERAIWKRDYRGGPIPDYACEERLVACARLGCTDPLPAADRSPCIEADSDAPGPHHWDWRLDAHAPSGAELRLSPRRGRVPSVMGRERVPVFVGVFAL
jgi:hypothetical protein